MGMMNQLLNFRFSEKVEKTLGLMLRNLDDDPKKLDAKWAHNITHPQEHTTSFDLKIQAGPSLPRLLDILSAEQGKMLGDVSVRMKEVEGIPTLVLHQELNPKEPNNKEAIAEKTHLSEKLDRILEQKIMVPRAQKILHAVAARIATDMNCPPPQPSDIQAVALGNDMQITFSQPDNPLQHRLRHELIEAATIIRKGTDKLMFGDQLPTVLPASVSHGHNIIAEAVNKLAENYALERTLRISTPLQPDGRPTSGVSAK